MNRTGKTKIWRHDYGLERNSAFSFSDLLYVQKIQSFGNRQTFHPKKLDYDKVNIEIDMGPVNLFLYGLLLKNLLFIEVNRIILAFLQFEQSKYLAYLIF